MKITVLFVINISFIVSSFCVTVPKLKLHDGREIPSLALGTWLGNNTQGRIKPQYDEVEKAVCWAIDAGYRHIDTAYTYKVEDQIGRALKKKIKEGFNRDELFITTKLWNPFHGRRAVIPALRDSLRLLQLDYVDLYLIHWPIGQFDNKTYDYTDYAETWRGMMDAKSLGLTKSIGVSNFNERFINRLLDLGLEKPAVLQVEVNLNIQQPTLLSYCKALNIVVMGYTPFGSLFYRDENAPEPRFDTLELVRMANSHNRTVPQIVLRYLVELGVIPIPKSINKLRIEENVDIFDFSLSEEDRLFLKSYDRNYRTVPQLKWIDHPYYPFDDLKPVKV